MKKQSKKANHKQNVDLTQCVDLSTLDEINKIEVTMNGKTLPLKIGDKIVFPEGDVILKTISAIQINETGNATYLLEWYDEGTFKQFWVSMTELKLMKDQMMKRTIVSFQQS